MKINVKFELKEHEDGYAVEAAIELPEEGASLEAVEAAASALVIAAHKTVSDEFDDADPAKLAMVHSIRLRNFYEKCVKNMSKALDLPVETIGQCRKECPQDRPGFDDLSRALSVMKVMGEIVSLVADCERDLDPKLGTELTAEVNLLIQKLDEDPNSVPLEDCEAVLGKVRSALDEARRQQLN